MELNGPTVTLNLYSPIILALVLITYILFKLFPCLQGGSKCVFSLLVSGFST